MVPGGGPACGAMLSKAGAGGGTVATGSGGGGPPQPASVKVASANALRLRPDSLGLDALIVVSPVRRKSLKLMKLSLEVNLGSRSGPPVSVRWRTAVARPQVEFRAAYVASRAPGRLSFDTVEEDEGWLRS